MKTILFILFIGVMNLTYSQSVQKIIDKHIEVIGGEKKLFNLTKVIEKRNIYLKQVGVSIKSILTIDKNKGLKTELKASSVSKHGVEIYNLKNVIKIEGNNFSNLSNNRAKYLDGIISDFPSPLLKHRFTLLKTEIYNGVSCFVLKRDDGNLYWINSNNHTIEKSKTKLFHEELGEVSITTTFHDYRKIDGVLFPFERHNIEYNQTITTDNIELNPPIDNLIFEAVTYTEENSTNKITENNITLPNPDKIPQEVFTRTRSYYAAVESMKSLEKSYNNNLALKNFYYDLYSTALSIAGLYKEALEARDLASNSVISSKKTINLDDYKPFNAIKEIESLADKHRAIFINEAHHVPQHRAFTHQLLQKLYDKGFRYFAAETLLPEDTGVIQQKERMLSYINEPEYADLIRTAIRIGYKIIPYEQESLQMVTLSDSQEVQRQSIIARETAQAKNLKERIFDKDKNAKVLVHAGYDHIMEKEHYGLDMMAKCFKDLTDIDPLTIDQVGLMEKGNFERSDVNYKYIIEKINPKEYIVLKNKNNNYWVTEDKKGKVDIQLIHPKTNYQNQRPLWKSLGGKRKQIIINPTKMIKQGIAKVFVSGEKLGVPIDRIYLNGENNSLTFYLPKGKFNLIITDQNGEVQFKKNISVE